MPKPFSIEGDIVFLSNTWPTSWNKGEEELVSVEISSLTKLISLIRDNGGRVNFSEAADLWNQRSYRGIEFPSEVPQEDIWALAVFMMDQILKPEGYQELASQVYETMGLT